MQESFYCNSPKSWRVEVDSISEAEWSSELEKFEDAGFYQTWAYGEISWGRRQLSHLVRRRGQEVLGMAQVRVISLLGRGVAYVRWGPAWRKKGQSVDPENFEHLVKALHAEYVLRRKMVLRIIPNVFAAGEQEDIVRSAFQQVGLVLSGARARYRTFILDLKPPVEALRKNLESKWRNRLNQSEKNGLTVVEGSDSQLYGTFKLVYKEMMERKAFDTTVSIDEFDRMQASLPSSQKLYTLIALKGETPVSALVGSTFGETGIYLLGATSNEGMQHKGSYLLQWRMIQRLKERGCRFYDLGGINPEVNPGVYEFKRGFGGEDRTQLGQFEVSRNYLSQFIVRFAEGARRRVVANGSARLNWLRRQKQKIGILKTVPEEG